MKKVHKICMNCKYVEILHDECTCCHYCSVKKKIVDAGESCIVFKEYGKKEEKK